MKIEKKKDESLEKHFKVTIPAKDLDKSINDEIAKIAKTIKMPGFRVGKVPISLITKKYGEAVRGDAVEKTVKEAITKIIDDNKLNPSSQPALEDLQSGIGKDLSFLLKIEILPEFTHPDLKKVKLERPVVKVEKKDVEDYIKNIAASSPDYTKESKVKSVKGDQLLIDFVGSVKGKEFDGGAAKGHKLVVGSNQFIPGFEDQLIGAKAGDKVDVKVTFPKEYHAKDLAGQEALFKTTVHKVFKEEKAKIDDQLAKKFGFEDLEALQKDAEFKLKNSENDQVGELMKLKLFDQLEKLLKFDVSDSMLNSELEGIKKQMKNIPEEKDDKKDAKKKTDSKKEDETYKKIALRRVRIGIYIADFAKKNNISVENRDLNQAVMKQAQMFPGSENAIIDFYTKNRQALEGLKGQVLEEKAVAHILNSEVEIKDKEYTLKDLQALIRKEMEKEVI